MKGPNQGKGLVLSPHDYHCKHDRAAWFDETWREVQANMCLGRRDDERTCAVESYCGGAEGWCGRRRRRQSASLQPSSYRWSLVFCKATSTPHVTATGAVTSD